MIKDNEILKDKQKYLREEIIENGYDPDKFYEYISSQGGENEINLEDWSLEKLKEVVNNFKNEPTTTININNNYLSDFETLNENNEFNKNNEININNDTIEEEKIEKNETSEKENLNNKTNDKIITLNNENLNNEKLNIEAAPIKKIGISIPKTYINCIRQEKNAFSDLNDLQIIITNPEYIKKGIFSFSYYQYTIIVPKFNVQCIRKTSDFEFLHEKLNLLYPLNFFPPFPESSFFNSTENINKKVRKLNLYINSLSQNELIRSCKLFQDFLLLPNEKFEKKKKEYNLIKNPNSIENYYSMNGNLEITMYPYKDEFNCNINSNIKLKNQLYEELDKAINDLITQFNVISIKINNVSNAFLKLSYNYTNNNENLSFNYSKFSKIFTTFNKYFLNQENFYQEEIRDEFKYMNKEISKFQNLYEEFIKGKNSFIEIQKILASNDIVINEKIEKEFNNKKNYYGFILNKCYDEFQRVNLMHSQRLNSLLQLFIIRNNKMVNDYLFFT